MSTLLHPGDRCAGHEILCLLGTGDYAEVYGALGPTGESRAFKLIATDEGLAAKVHARLAQEGELLSLVVHPSVVRFHDAGVWCDRVWLSLELVEGDTLRQRLRAAGGRVPLDDLLHWFQQACDGIAEAHRVGIVHRNLAPENLLIAPGDVVKVIDFILAKLHGQGVKTSTEQQLGTVMYMSPEQTLSAPAHPSMDVYAMALVLYEAIAGVHAMGPRALPMIEIVHWHLSGQALPLRAHAPDVPPEVEALVHQSLSKDPAQRPTMRAFTDCLRDALSRLREPQRRAARSVPLPSRALALASTMRMPNMGGPASASEGTTGLVVASARGGMQEGPTGAVVASARGRLPEGPTGAMVASARGGTLRMARVEVPLSPLRSGPATDPPPTIRSATEYDPSVMMPAAAASRESAPAGLRSTDVPVESTIRPSIPGARRRAPIAGLAVGAVTLAATAMGWMFHWRVSAQVIEPAAAPRPAASALPPPAASASAAPAPTGTAAASATPAVPANTRTRRAPTLQ